MPHLAVVAFNLISIILVLIFVRFRFASLLSKMVCLVLDALVALLLLALILVCVRFSTL